MNSNRFDYWNYLIHFTSDTKDGYKAFENLLEILIDKKIKAFNHNFLFKNDLKSLRKVYQSYFKTVSLTEIPGNDLLPFVEQSDYFSEFGIAFSKEFIIKNKGNPVFYLVQDDIIKSAWSIWKENRKQPVKLKNKANFFIQFNYYKFIKRGKLTDFAREREWRVLGDLKFGYSDIEFLSLPNPESFWDFASIHSHFSNDQHASDFNTLKSIQVQPIHFGWAPNEDI